MPTSGSSSISRAIRCSAERPWMPNASRSPRTRWICLSGPTRPSAVPRSESSTSPWWQGRSRADLEVERAVVVQLVEIAGDDVELGHPGVAGVGVADRLGAVLLGVQPDGCGLDPQRQVLGDQGDLVALVGEVARHCQDPGVVVAEAEARGQGHRVGVVQLDAEGAAVLADRDGLVESPVQDPQLVEHPQRAAREEAQLRVVPLALQLGDHHDRQHHLVLGEPAQGAWVGQQDAGVEDVGVCCIRRGGRGGLQGGGLRLRGLRRHDDTPYGPRRALHAPALVHG